VVALFPHGTQHRYHPYLRVDSNYRFSFSDGYVFLMDESKKRICRIYLRYVAASLITPPLRLLGYNLRGKKTSTRRSKC